MKAAKVQRAKRPESALRKWKVYKKFYKAIKEKNHLSDADKTLNRFEARFNLASKFKEIVADDIKPATLRGYVAGMRLVFAYSAAELLCSAIGGQVKKWEIEDKRLAGSLRMMLRGFKSKDRNTLDHTKFFIDKAEPRRRFDDFLHRKNDDVRIVLRNAMAHGAFTPNAFDIYNSKNAATLNRLTKRLLRECQNKFNEWLTEEMRKA